MIESNLLPTFNDILYRRKENTKKCLTKTEIQERLRGSE